MCPFCHSVRELSKNGSYVRPSDGYRLRRFRCRDCRKTFSETHFSIHYRLRKRRINQAVFRFLSSGVSQRRCAFLVGVMPRAIARRVDRFGRCSAHNLDVYRKNRELGQLMNPARNLCKENPPEPKLWGRSVLFQLLPCIAGK